MRSWEWVIWNGDTAIRNAAIKAVRVLKNCLANQKMENDPNTPNNAGRARIVHSFTHKPAIRHKASKKYAKGGWLDMNRP